MLIVFRNELGLDAFTSLLDVRGMLEQMRLLTTRLHVVQPYYLWLSLGAIIQTYPGVSFAEVRNKAIEKLQQYFNPLPGGGADGSGWPFGRAVYLSEVYELLEHIEGVDYVQEVRVLRLTTTAEAVSDERTAVGIQIGTRSTVGVDSRLGCEIPADTDRLSQDSVGRLMGVMLRPYELVRIAVQEHDVLPGDDSTRGRSAQSRNGVP